VRHEVCSSLAGESGYFDDLDHDLGPGGSCGRLLALEGDRRWVVEYHKFSSGGEPAAVVPVYRRRPRSWPNSFFTPDFGDAAGVPGTDECLLVGGRDGLNPSFHVREQMRTPEVYSEIVAAIVGSCGQKIRYLYFPCFRKSELDLIGASAAVSLRRVPIGEDARLDRLFGDWDKDLRTRHRKTLRRDVVAAERLGVRTAACSWREGREVAVPLIVEHNQRMGNVDRPDLVDFRIRQWEGQDGVRVLVYKAWTRSVMGVLAATVWRDWMELREIGMSVGDGEERRCVYAQLIAHLPVETGREMGLRRLGAGFSARRPKAQRGAFFLEVESGLLRVGANPG
jgi:hypothetical protein